MSIAKLFHIWRRHQLYKQLRELDDHLLGDLGYQRCELPGTTDTRAAQGLDMSHVLRPGASCCSIAGRGVSLSGTNGAMNRGS